MHLWRRLERLASRWARVRGSSPDGPGRAELARAGHSLPRKASLHFTPKPRSSDLPATVTWLKQSKVNFPDIFPLASILDHWNLPFGTSCRVVQNYVALLGKGGGSQLRYDSFIRCRKRCPKGFGEKISQIRCYTIWKKINLLLRIVGD